MPKKVFFKGSPLTLVLITLTTHAAGGLTDNDFLMAKFIDQLNTKD